MHTAYAHSAVYATYYRLYILMNSAAAARATGHEMNTELMVTRGTVVPAMARYQYTRWLRRAWYGGWAADSVAAVDRAPHHMEATSDEPSAHTSSHSTTTTPCRLLAAPAAAAAPAAPRYRQARSTSGLCWRPSSSATETRWTGCRRPSTMNIERR